MLDQILSPKKANVGDCKDLMNQKHFLFSLLHRVSIYIDHLHGFFAAAKNNSSHKYEFTIFQITIP